MISKFWDGTQSFLGGEQAAIPHLKEHIQGFHMNPNAIIFISKIGLFRVNYTSKPVAPTFKRRQVMSVRQERPTATDEEIQGSMEEKVLFLGNSKVHYYAW